MASEVSIQIPDELIQATVLGELARQTGDPEKVFANMIASALTSDIKVGYREIPLWKKLMQDLVQEEARRVFKEMLEEQRPKVVAALKKKITAARYAGRMADALTISAEEARWRVDVKLDLND